MSNPDNIKGEDVLSTINDAKSYVATPMRSIEILIIAVAILGLLSILISYMLADVPPKKASHRLSKDHYKNGKSRIFLLTGCASGVGKHMTGVLLSYGHTVIATDINQAALEKLEVEWNSMISQQKKGRVIISKMDVSKRDEWDRVITLIKNEIGTLDVLMNIAGYLQPGKIQEESIEKVIDIHVNVNVIGVINGTRAASRYMIDLMREGKLEHGGHIINFASIGGKTPVPGLTLYSATKYACRGFSLCAAKDLYNEGVYVSVVCPDAIRTPMLDLQVAHENAALTFSGAGALTVQDIERKLMDVVLPYRTREVIIVTEPFRGIALLLGDMFSASRAVNFIEGLLKFKGMKAQKSYTKSE